MFNFIHSYSPQPILFELGPLSIHWYGFLMVVGGLLGFWLILILAKRCGLDKKFFSELLLPWVVGAVIGARLYYVVYAWEMYRENWLDVFKIWQGGLAVHGIMLGGFVTTWIYCRIKKQKFFLAADLIVVGLAAAQVIGRVGNYFNQEIFGRPTDLPWGIPIDVINRPAGYFAFEYFHPAFLYESLGSLMILGILSALWFRRLKTKQQIAGNIFWFYLVLYSGQRFLLEFLRLDYSPLVCGVRWAQLLSIGIIFASAAVIWANRYRSNRRLE